jgi:predicted SprT family Zn-dependent metalloprotease
MKKCYDINLSSPEGMKVYQAGWKEILDDMRKNPRSFTHKEFADMFSEKMNKYAKKFLKPMKKYTPCEHIKKKGTYVCKKCGCFLK